MDTVASAALLTAAGAGLLGWFLPTVIAWRSGRQPVSQDLHAERRVLAWCAQHPHQQPPDGLGVHHFTSTVHALVWSSLTGARVPSSTVVVKASKVEAARLLADLTEVPYPVTGEDLDRDVATLLQAEQDRSIVGTVAAVHREHTHHPLSEPVMVIPHQRVRVARRAWYAAVVGLGGGILAGAIWSHTPDVVPAGLLTVVAVVALCSAAVVAGVDRDTCYVDYPVLVPATVLLLPAVSALSWGVYGLSTVLIVLLTTVVFMAGLELLNWVWSRLTGSWGMGGGDTWCIPLAFTVPALAIGNALAIPVALLAGTVLLLAWVAAQRALHRDATQVAHHPMVPALVTGGIAAVLITPALMPL